MKNKFSNRTTDFHLLDESLVYIEKPPLNFDERGWIFYFCIGQTTLDGCSFSIYNISY